MAPVEMNDSPCLGPGVALDFKVSNEGLKRVSDKSSLDMTDINEPKSPFLRPVEL